ncbi:cilia- and flagella-associated protein 77-like isoform X2 [Convolutriloba macropyga]|uniref:cilia- and flagella-associated protein 77-like isoform X2 n=1 Tax=Convolutriloba macropyga TaxID=536237 RepID=UPI003F52101A
MTAIEITHDPLLQHAELGRSTRRGHELPPDSFVYGISTTGDQAGAAKALGSWSGLENDSIRKISHPAGPLTRSKTFNDRDFVAMNKAATKKGLHTATDFSRFRSTHNIEKGQMTMSANTNKAEIGRVPPETVFGQPTRACTPVFDLMENKYQHKWLQQRKDQEMLSRARSRLSKMGTRGIYETRASLLRKYLPPIENHEMWQISKFKKVGPHVSSFRSAGARRSALENHELEGASRFGYLGQGAHATPPY